MQRIVKIDRKVRTDTNYPTGFMDVITIEKKERRTNISVYFMIPKEDLQFTELPLKKPNINFVKSIKFILERKGFLWQQLMMEEQFVIQIP